MVAIRNLYLIFRLMITNESIDLCVSQLALSYMKSMGDAYFALKIKKAVIYCNGFAQSVSRQRLGKHVPTCNNGKYAPVDECPRMLLGNSQLANKPAG
jgi:hypothetical protein